jgi:hypothetical protein
MLGGGGLATASRVLLARPGGWQGIRRILTAEGGEAVNAGSGRLAEQPSSAFFHHAMVQRKCRVEREEPGAHRVSAIW